MSFFILFFWQCTNSVARRFVHADSVLFLFARFVLFSLTSSILASKASTNFTRNSKQSPLNRRVRALSNPWGAGAISTFLFLACKRKHLMHYDVAYSIKWKKRTCTSVKEALTNKSIEFLPGVLLGRWDRITFKRSAAQSLLLAILFFVPSFSGRWA